MSIATEITRLQTAKTDLKTAIEGKGVTVPSATKIDGYADLVDSIETGGGGGDIDAIIDGSITAVESDATVVEEYKFYNCTHLASVKFNEPVWIKGNAFRGCTALQTFDAKKAYRIFGNSFTGVLANLVFANITDELGTSALSGWLGQKIDLDGSAAFEIKMSTFSNASNFNVLIIRKNSRIILGNINAFSGTPFTSSGTGGTIYVPRSLLSEYTQATNWSTILGYTNNQILPIEGSIYETQYADGTPISA